MGILRVRLYGAETSENLSQSWPNWLYVHRTQRRQARALVTVFGSLAVASVFVGVLERTFNIAFALLGIGLGLFAVGWLVYQVIAEIGLRRSYDTPAQRAEALRQRAQAWRERQAIAAQEAAAAPRETASRQLLLQPVSGPASASPSAGGPGAPPSAGSRSRAHRTIVRGYRNGSGGAPRRLPRC
jgi:hypothetical protein